MQSAVEYARVNRIPSAASRSMLGVLIRRATVAIECLSTDVIGKVHDDVWRSLASGRRRLTRRRAGQHERQHASNADIGTSNDRRIVRVLNIPGLRVCERKRRRGAGNQECCASARHTDATGRSVARPMIRSAVPCRGPAASGTVCSRSRRTRLRTGDAPAPIASARFGDLRQLSEVQPDQVAPLTRVDDDVARTVVRVHVHLRPA